MHFLAICFVVGLIFVKLSSDAGRGFIGGVIGLSFIFFSMAALGAVILAGGLALLLFGIHWLSQGPARAGPYIEQHHRFGP